MSLNSSWILKGITFVDIFSELFFELIFEMLVAFFWKSKNEIKEKILFEFELLLEVVHEFTELFKEIIR